MSKAQENITLEQDRKHNQKLEAVLAEKDLALPFEVEHKKALEKEQEVITYVMEKNNTQKEHPGRLALPSHS